MTDKPNRVFVGQAKKHEGKYGEYFTFRMGAAMIFFEPSKTPGTLNAYIKEMPQADKYQETPRKQEPFRGDEEMPF